MTGNLRDQIADALNEADSWAQLQRRDDRERFADAVLTVITPHLCTAVCRDVERERDELYAVNTQLDAETERLRQRAEQAEAAVAEYQRQIGYLADDVKRAEAERDAASLIVAELQTLRDSLYAHLDSAQQRAEQAEDRIKGLEARLVVGAMDARVGELMQRAEQAEATIARVHTYLAGLKAGTSVGVPRRHVIDGLTLALDAPESPQDGPTPANPPDDTEDNA